jgi:enterochelin esterase-like enzyme
MVFQDGYLYLDPADEMRVPIVFDNLIDRGEMPVTIGVFVDPGEPENRNLEYDTFSDAYATFLLTEISRTFKTATSSAAMPRTGGAILPDALHWLWRSESR